MKTGYEAYLELKRKIRCKSFEKQENMNKKSRHFHFEAKLKQISDQAKRSVSTTYLSSFASYLQSSQSPYMKWIISNFVLSPHTI